MQRAALRRLPLPKMILKLAAHPLPISKPNASAMVVAEK